MSKAAAKLSKPPITIPDLVIDPGTKQRYKKGRLLGKGGFAHCYELIDLDTNTVYAGKVVPKTLLTKPHQRDKMAMEIDIHRSVDHKHIVGFHGYFEDSNNVYIILELCRRRSLMELHRRRKALTEPEVRYLMQQILQAVLYLHDKKQVIHRDLKLGNLFLNDDLQVKVGDFGLATRVEVEGERKRTLCGTPNYIAPEVLGKKGHSYEVDIWSLGCILYTLLVGKPPFETKSLEKTYQRIKQNEYCIPSHVGPEARLLISKLLRPNPSARPMPAEILADPFFSSGYMPSHLPLSCLTTVPYFKRATVSAPSRKPLGDLNTEVGVAANGPLKPALVGGVAVPLPPPCDDNPGDWYLHSLLSQLSSAIESKPSDKPACRYDDSEDPAAIPIFWVSKWVDYSDKYGLGYQLCDTSVGVLYNDSSRMLLGADGESLQYITRDLKEEFHVLSSFPGPLYKKVTLLKYFRNYMSEHLLKAGGSAGERAVDEGVRLPHLRTWFRTRSAIVLHLSNGILQINFFQDHTKVIICPLMSAVSYIDENKTFRTFRLPLIEQYGCSRELLSRLRYAKTMSERLISKLDGQKPAGSTADHPLPSPAIPILTS